MTVEVYRPVRPRPALYGVVFNALDTPEQLRDYDRWEQTAARARRFRPCAALLQGGGNNVKLPLSVEGASPGNDSEGVNSRPQIDRITGTLPPAST